MSSPDAREEPRRCVSVVVPVYNERATVERIIRRVLGSPYVHELIVVDDCSTDGTREILEGLADHLGFRLLVQDPNQGKGAALRRGFAAVTGEIVIVQDADLEYNPNDYGALIQPILDELADIVYGSRFLSGPHRVLYFWHAVGNKILTTLSNMFTDLNLTDMETCYKAFRAEVLADLRIEEDRFGFEPEFTSKVAKRGYRIFEVPISYAGRSYAEGKKIGWRDGVSALRCIAKYGVLEELRRRRAGGAGRGTGVHGVPEHPDCR
jgi:glycosyltransferase involved in cell wall biosynthesis